MFVEILTCTKYSESIKGETFEGSRNCKFVESFVEHMSC